MERQQVWNHLGMHPTPTANPGATTAPAGTLASPLVAAESPQIAEFRRSFPALEQEVHPGKRLVYLDSAATALKPWPVIRSVAEYQAFYPANVHRGLHALSERATDAFEEARAKIARFIGAAEPAEIIFTRGATDALNLAAAAWARTHLKAGDEIVLNVLEHHSNLVPWQMVARDRGAVLRYAELTDDGRLEVEAIERVLSPRTRLVAVTGMSNVLGTIPPVQQIAALAHQRGAVVVVDGSQSVPHGPTDVQSLGADFLAFAGHKLFGPTGVGVLYGRRELLESMPPAAGGGSMVLRVDQNEAEWNEVPYKFEAGTPPIAEAIGLGAAVEFLGQFSWEELTAHERRLTEHAHQTLDAIPGFRRLGPDAAHKGSIVAFTVAGVHPHDLAQLVDREGVAIRAGHHCAMPLHTRYGLPATARASLAFYNSTEDIDRLAEAIRQAQAVFGARRR